MITLSLIAHLAQVSQEVERLGFHPEVVTSVLVLITLCADAFIGIIPYRMFS